jgi:hypothetical protein
MPNNGSKLLITCSQIQPSPSARSPYREVMVGVDLMLYWELPHRSLICAPGGFSFSSPLKIYVRSSPGIQAFNRYSDPSHRTAK